MTEAERNTEVFYYGEKISGYDIIPVDSFELFQEAAELENGVEIGIIKNEGESHIFEHADGNVNLEIPQRHILVRASTHGRTLDAFWNTFDALCEYDKPQ